MGVERALESFDPAIMPFTTYAVWWIRQRIFVEMAAHNTRYVKLPRTALTDLNRWSRAEAALVAATGAVPTPDRVAAMAAVTSVDGVRALIAFNGLRKRPVEERDDRQFRGACLCEPAARPCRDEDAYACAVGREDRAALDRALRHLDPKWRRVVVLRYGLDVESDGVPRTLKEVSDLMGITRERVRQVEAVALKRLAATLGGVHVPVRRPQAGRCRPRRRRGDAS